MNKLILLFLSFLAAIQLSAQQGGISVNGNGAAPHPSAMIDVSSSTKGSLIPRMTTTERNAIVNPAIGLEIFNTTTNCFNFWLGSTWKQVCGDCDFNSPIAGNSGPICEGSTLNLTATTIIGAVYSWSGPNGFTSSLQNPVIPDATAGASGSYSVSATLNGCTSQLQSTVATVNATPVTPAASNDGPVCVGAILNLGATAVTSATYSWTGPNGYSASVQNPIITSAQVNNSGMYSVTATVNGCVSSAGTTSVAVNSIPASPGSISGSALACPNDDDMVYSVSPVSGATSYNWTVPSGATITSNSGVSITVTFGSNPAGNITVSATNVCGTSGLTTLAISQEPYCSPMTFNATGTGPNGTIQSFTVPAGVTELTIDAYGAQGGANGNGGNIGGRGARIKGTITVSPGDVLKILVGQMGTENYNGASGGGGSFVATSSNVPLIVAGGGGGAGTLYSLSNADASITTTGKTGYHPERPGPTNGEAPGGTNGNGGNAGRLTPGGGGFYTDGQYTNSDGGNSIPGTGKAFVNGGNGGASATTQACAQSISAPGGFGGGGGAGYAAAGSGGGYSGGGGTDGCNAGTGGGGGSYNSGTNQTNTAGVQTGHGQVILTW